MTEHIKHPEINAKKIFIEDEVLNTNHIINAADVAGANLSNALEGLREAITASNKFTGTGFGDASKGVLSLNVDGKTVEFNKEEISITVWKESIEYTLNTEMTIEVNLAEDGLNYIVCNPETQTLSFTSIEEDPDLLYIASTLVDSGEIIWLGRECRPANKHYKNHWSSGVFEIDHIPTTPTIRLASEANYSIHSTPYNIPKDVIPKNQNEISVIAFQRNPSGHKWINISSGAKANEWVKTSLFNFGHPDVYNHNWEDIPSNYNGYYFTVGEGGNESSIVHTVILTNCVLNPLKVILANMYENSVTESMYKGVFTKLLPKNSFIKLCKVVIHKNNQFIYPYTSDFELGDQSVGPVRRHNHILLREEENAHPISAITGLGTALEDLEDNKVDKTSIKQGIGSSTTDVMSQKAVADGLNTKFDKESVKQVIGTSLTEVMSQDAASKNFLIDANNTSQRKVFVQNGTPTGMNVGDIWIKI